MNHSISKCLKHKNELTRHLYKVSGFLINGLFEFSDPPPDYLTNKFCLSFWHSSKEIRNVLNSPAWRERVKKGQCPYFCMHNGFCRYFEDRQGLESHFRKNPHHRPSETKTTVENPIKKPASFRPPSPKEPHPDDKIEDKQTENTFWPPLTTILQKEPTSGIVQKENTSIILPEPPKINRLIPTYIPPTTTTSTLLGRLKLSMPKPDFSRSVSLNLDYKEPRDPRRKRKLLPQNSMFSSSPSSASPTSPKSFKIDEIEKSEKCQQKKISLAQYKKSKESTTVEEVTQLFEEVDQLPDVSELFKSQESFEPETPVKETPNLNNNNNEKSEKEVKNEACQELEIPKFSSTTRVSSWTHQKSKEVINECDFFVIQDNVPNSVAQVEVKSIEQPENEAMILIKGIDKSIDFCPKCHRKLCPFKGGYSINCSTFDVSLTCHKCSTKVVIKEAFNEKEKATLWMTSVL